jgi:hypothetical protein
LAISALEQALLPISEIGQFRYLAFRRAIATMDGFTTEGEWL